MKYGKMKIVLLLLAALFLGFAGAYTGVKLANQGESTIEQSANKGATEKADEQAATTPKDMQKVVQAYTLIKQNYLKDVDDKQLIEGAIQGMLTTLEDPFSSYMDAESMKDFNEQIEAEFEGIGAEVSMVEGKVTIVAPIKDSPAEKAGLRPNDQVLSVDGKSLEGLDLNEAVAKIRGEKGSEVVLEVKRAAASEPFDVTIVRDTIPVETVYNDLKTINGKKTGILEVTNFSEHTAEEFTKQLDSLEKKGIEGLVIDVRGNPGGLLNVVEDMLKLFIPEDMPYLQIEDQNGDKTPYYSQLKEKKEYPITVLVDEGSASASEILAVAMKEAGYDVVGQTSFGKGTVQQAVPLGDGSTIKLTFYKWLSPKGNWINEKGVEPTIEKKQPDYYYSNPIQIDDPFGFDQSDEKIGNIQKMLSGLDYEPGREDGYFSKETVKAVKEFQQKNDIKVTGEVDKKTAGLLETKIVEKIRNGEDDVQLDTALKALYK
ncbi:S41 family peptidase [Virgibacillus halodenitrificans]|uniref:S41 family peptidase n=1 Tax=Virgibacillus halodenitrificans TaxID=1482 RepID=UPI00031F4C35|nr:S41 family peptidase [Virgibacillus halodenitrificans]MCG1026860.1 peptidoglycan-binding protein [Virgibacillus halodenitrificans]MCJ0932993.1 S41 family peptidase [Virgibacillus halodenitrificans]CDQ30820.1 Carboxy-terminal processing protease CtpB precursor [Virgibacillus halodenitrificans]